MEIFERYPMLLTHLRNQRIIVAALAGGIVSFAVVALALRPRMAGSSDQSMASLSYLTIAVALVMPACLFPVAAALGRQGARAAAAAGSDATARAAGGAAARAEEAVLTRLSLAFLGRTVMRAASFEGPAIFGVVAYLLNGSPIPLVVAVACLAGVLGQLPGRSRLRDWLEESVQLAAAARSRGR